MAKVQGMDFGINCGGVRGRSDKVGREDLEGKCCKLGCLINNMMHIYERGGGGRFEICLKSYIFFLGELISERFFFDQRRSLLFFERERETKGVRSQKGEGGV